MDISASGTMIKNSAGFLVGILENGTAQAHLEQTRPSNGRSDDGQAALAEKRRSRMLELVGQVEARANTQADLKAKWADMSNVVSAISGGWVGIVDGGLVPDEVLFAEDRTATSIVNEAYQAADTEVSHANLQGRVQGPAGRGA
jgi:hypothetical protein